MYPFLLEYAWRYQVMISTQIAFEYVIFADVVERFLRPKSLPSKAR